jgi:N-glycosylase/DNA lyase
VAYGRFVSFAQDGDTLYIYGSDLADFEAVWRGYLDLDRDYREVERDVLEHSQNSALIAAIEYGRGIRILSQEPFECVISFIISQNNNIPRIKKIIEALSERCGERIELCDEAKKHLSGCSSLCAFPDAEAIYELGESGLFELKTGFRAKYIYDAACRVCDGRISFSEIYAAPTAEASKMLEEISGVGPKVAACTLLFGFGKLDAFPVDVWIRRVIEKYGFDPAALGDFAGLAQQYLFYYVREKNSGK